MKMKNKFKLGDVVRFTEKSKNHGTLATVIWRTDTGKLLVTNPNGLLDCDMGMDTIVTVDITSPLIEPYKLR
jgi:hypothetical protein